MTAPAAPFVRRYWFVGSETLSTMADAIDPPEWPACNVPTIAFALDDDVYELLAEVVGQDETILVERLGCYDAIAESLAARLERETAHYVQFIYHGFIDFGPGFELVQDYLKVHNPGALAVRNLKTTRWKTVLSESGDHLASHNYWLRTDLSREAATDNSPKLGSAADLDAFVATVAATAEPITRFPFVAGAYFATETHDEAPTEAEIARARLASLHRENDALSFERRHAKVVSEAKLVRADRQHDDREAILRRTISELRDTRGQSFRKLIGRITGNGDG